MEKLYRLISPDLLWHMAPDYKNTFEMKIRSVYGTGIWSSSVPPKAQPPTLARAIWSDSPGYLGRRRPDHPSRNDLRFPERPSSSPTARTSLRPGPPTGTESLFPVRPTNRPPLVFRSTPGPGKMSQRFPRAGSTGTSRQNPAWSPISQPTDRPGVRATLSTSGSRSVSGMQPDCSRYHAKSIS